MRKFKLILLVGLVIVIGLLGLTSYRNHTADQPVSYTHLTLPTIYSV